MRQVEGFALDVGAGIQQNKFIVRRGDDGGNCPPVNTGDAAKLEGRRRENAAGIAGGHYGIHFALVGQFNRAGNGAILFPPERGGGLVGHGQDLASVDYAHAMVAKAALGQSGVDFASMADEIESGDLWIGLQSPIGAFDHNPATVVATHDIHCDSHKQTGSSETRPARKPLRPRRSP